MLKKPPFSWSSNRQKILGESKSGLGMVRQMSSYVDEI